MEVLLLDSDAYVQERYREIEAEQRTTAHNTTHARQCERTLHEADEFTLASLAKDMCADSPDEKELLAKRRALQQRMYRDCANDLDAKWPTSHLERKLVVLRALLADLYSAERVTLALGNKQKIAMKSNIAQQKAEAVSSVTIPSPPSKHKSLDDGAAPMPFEDLPLATQLGLRIFFRFCRSLHEPGKLAANCRVLLPVAARLPALLAALPSFPLSPGFVAPSSDAAASGALDQSSMYDSSGNPRVLSVFQSLIGLLSDLLHLPSTSSKALPSTTTSNTSISGPTAAAGGILSSSDRSVVLTAYIALCLKWGSLRHLLSVILMLLDSDANMVTTSQFQQLESLFVDVAYAVPEAIQSAIQQTEDSCCGYLMSFGKGDHGKLGHGQCSHASCTEGNCTENKNSPTMISATRDVQFAKIDSLSTHSVSITMQGEVMAWGNGDKYRLGHGTAAKEYTPRAIESLSMKGGGGVRVVDISCGLGHTIALMESGELFSWGNGSNGRLGLGDTTDRATPTKILTSALHSSDSSTQAINAAGGTLPTRLGTQLFCHVYCGASHSLATSFDGRAYAWGKNNQGQCGHGHTNDQLSIHEVKFFRDEVDEDISHAAGGWEHTLFCSASGRVFSAGCGYKDSRRTGIPPVLGHGDCERRIKPTVVQFFIDNNDEITKVACGWDHSLAVTAMGLVYSWGSGTNGKLGHGDEENCDVPTLIIAMEGKQVKVAKAGCEHTVLLTDEQEVWTFGQGDSGRLGHGDNLTRKVPTLIESFSHSGLRPVAIAVGDKYNLVLVEDFPRSSDRSQHHSAGSKHLPTSSSVSSSGGSGFEHHHRKRRSSFLRGELEKRRHLGNFHTTNLSPSRYEADWVLAVGENMQKQQQMMIQSGDQKLSDSSKSNLDIMENDSRSNNRTTHERSSDEANQTEQQELAFYPKSRSACTLFLLGHIDRLAAAYFSEDKDKFCSISDGYAEPSDADDEEQDFSVLPFSIDTSREAFVLLLRILRLQCSSPSSSTVSSIPESSFAAGDGSRFLLLQRMCVALSCLRILKANLSKSLQVGRRLFSATRSLLQQGRTSSASELEAVNALDEIHCLVNKFASASVQGILELFGTRSVLEQRDCGSKAPQSQSELLSIAKAVSQEAADVLQVGFVLFYPLPASRRELLWELTSQEFGSDNSVYGMKMLVLANRLCEADVMDEIFLHAFARESPVRSESKHFCVGGTNPYRDRDSTRMREGCDADKDRTAADLVDLMTNLVQRSSVEAVSHLEADNHQQSQHNASPANDASLRILAVLQVHLLGLTTAFLDKHSINHPEGHLNNTRSEHQAFVADAICSCAINALLLYLDTLFAESMIVLKKLHKASCQHEEVVTGRLNGSFFRSLLPNAIQALCLLLPQANTVWTNDATKHELADLQRGDLGLCFAHRLLPHVYPMLKMLDEVNWKMRYNPDDVTDNQTRHEFKDDSGVPLETNFVSQDSRSWVLELQDACGVLCGKLACVTASHQFAPAEPATSTGDSGFDLLKARVLSANFVCASVSRPRLDTTEIPTEVTAILHWEENGVFEVENELEPSDDAHGSDSLSGPPLYPEQVTRDQQYLMSFIESSPSSAEQLALWIAADQAQEGQLGPCLTRDDGHTESRFECPMRAVTAILIWNCKLVDVFRGCYDRLQGCSDGGESSVCGDTLKEADIKGWQSLHQILQRVSTLAEVSREELNSAVSDVLDDTILQNARFLLTLRPIPLHFSGIEKASSAQNAQNDLIMKLLRLVTEPTGASQWEASVIARSIDTALFRIGLCFFHDLLRKLTISSTKSCLLGELITTMRLASDKGNVGNRKTQLLVQDDNSSSASQPGISKSIENLYIRLAKLISADESSPSVKEKALLAWTISLEELGLSAGAAADVIAKAGITHVIGDLLVDDVGILETHASYNECTEHSSQSGQDGTHMLNVETHHASQVGSGDSSWARASQRLKPVTTLLFSQTPPQALGMISWTALCAIALQLTNSSNLYTHRNGNNRLLASGPASPASASFIMSTRPMSGKDYASPRTAVSPRKRLTLPKRTIVSTVSDSFDQVYELVFLMLTTVKLELEVQVSRAQRMARLLSTDSKSLPTLTGPTRTQGRVSDSGKEELIQALLFGHPVPITSASRQAIGCVKSTTASAILRREAVSALATHSGITICVWLYIEQTGAVAVTTGGRATQPPLEKSKRLSEPPVLFALGSGGNEKKAGVIGENDPSTASPDAILVESELVVFARKVTSKRVVLAVGLRRQGTAAPDQSMDFNADNQDGVTAPSSSSWETLVSSEDFQVGQWTHLAITFQEAQNTLTAFLDGKSVGFAKLSARDSSSSRYLSSRLRSLSVGGKLSEQDVALIGPVEGAQEVQTLSESQETRATHNTSSKNSYFEGVLDDVLVLSTPLDHQEIAWLSRRGPVLFQLKRQYVAELHCTDLLQLLCQLTQQDLNTGEQAQDSMTAAPLLSTRWVVLFAQLLDKFPCEVHSQQHNLHDHVHVLLCELLQRTLPEIAPSMLSENFLSNILKRVFENSGLHRQSVEENVNLVSSIRNVYLRFNGALNGLSSSRPGDPKCNETLQMLMRDSRLGCGEHSHASHCGYKSPPATRCGKAPQAIPDAIVQSLPKLSSLRIAAGVRLFQSIWKSSVWREEIQCHLERATLGFLQTESATGFDGSLFAVCFALGGYCEVATNQTKAASMKTSPALALFVFSEIEPPSSSTMRIRDVCASTPHPIMSLVIAALGCKLSLPGHLALGDDQCHEDTLKTSKELPAADHCVVTMVHSRASILRFVAQASQEGSELLWQHAGEKGHEPGTLVEQLFQLASTSTVAFICATLGPDHKKALKLRSIRTLLHELLQLMDRKQSTTTGYTFPSIAKIEALAWEVWEDCSEQPRFDSKNGPLWWQKKKKHQNSLLETMGGEVTINSMTAMALEHFATVRLGGNVAIAANSGLWFYEVTVLTDGLMQIGYIDADFAPDPVQGQGVGDHASSWAFDGFRCKKWNVSSSDYGEAWRAEDVVGVLLDTDRMELSFFLNGKFLGVAFSGISMTQTSRMCPAASVNADQVAQFNFGSSLSGTETKTQNGQQQQGTDQLFAFAHPPVLDSEQDQSRLQPVVLAISQPSSHSASKRRRNISCASSGTSDLVSEGEEMALNALNGDDQSETNNNDGVTGEVAQSSGDEEDDDDNGGAGGGGDMESFGLRLPSTTLFAAAADTDDDNNVRDLRSRENAAGNSSSDAIEDDALAARRNDLIDGLTGLGFPREWAIRCAIETNLSIHESGAVSWILEQMEKDATAGAESTSLRTSTEGIDVVERQMTLFGDLSSITRSADDLALLSSSASVGGANFPLTLPSAHRHSYGLYPGMTSATQGFRPHTEHLSRSRLELFSELQTIAKNAPRSSSSSTSQDARRSSSGGQMNAPNLYLVVEQEDVDFSDELTSCTELFSSREYSGKGLEQLLAASQSAGQASKKPPSAIEKGPQDRANHHHLTADGDDAIPLCLTLDSLLTVLYARHALLNLLTSGQGGEEHTRQVLQFVSSWCLKTDSLRRLIRFLKATLGIEKHEPVTTGGGPQVLNTASELLRISSRLQRKFRVLLKMEIQRSCDTTANTTGEVREPSIEQQQQLPVFHALFNEMRDQCVQSLSVPRGAETKSRSPSAGSVGQRAAWVLWLAGVVFPSSEVYLKQRTEQDQAVLVAVLGPVVATTCFSLSFFQTLVAMASGATLVTMPWKVVAFTMMKRVLCGISSSQPTAVDSSVGALNSNRSWASDPMKAFESAAQMHNLLDLFALRYRKENASRVFFSSLTQTIFGLVARHPKSIRSIQAIANAESIEREVRSARMTDFCIETFSSNFATISWTPEFYDQDTSDDGSSGGAENTVLSLSVHRLPDPFHDELHGANDHSPRVLPSKGTYTIRNLAPDTRYMLRLSPVQTMMSRNSASQNAFVSTENETSEISQSEPNSTIVSCSIRELYFQTPPEPLFQLDAESIGKNLTLLNRNLSVKNVVNKKWHTVRASVGFDEGVHHWHVRIDTCVSKNIFIGVCTSQASMENYIGSDGFGYGFLANKAVWHNKSKLHSYGEIFKQGDLLQVTLDCNAKTLAFSRNGEYLGIAATNLHTAGPGSSSYASLGLSASEACKWYPAFSMYNKDDQLTITPPCSAARLADSAPRQQQQQLHASILELVEAMQVVIAYQQMGSNSMISGVSHQLCVAAYEDFHRWKCGEILFRERELGHFIRISASHSATQRFGFFKGDSVFSSQGQATVLGEFNHELWYECDSSTNSGSDQQNEPGLGSWSLHACKQMLASPSEFPVHRHARSHHQQQYYQHQYMTDPALGSLEHSDERTQKVISEGSPTGITVESFEKYQEEWTQIPFHEALDAQLMEILDRIAASRAISDSQCLSFVDISAAFLLDKVQVISPLSAMLTNLDIELSTELILARIGVLLHVNRNLYKVVRLVLPEPAAASKWSAALAPKSLAANEPQAKRETDTEAEDKPKANKTLSEDAKKRNTYANAVITTDFIAGLANSPQWNHADPSRFANMNQLTKRLLFQAQKAKLIDESMRKTATPTLNSPLVNNDLQSQASELTSSTRDDSYDPGDLPRIHVRYPERDGSHFVPFWSNTSADPLKQYHRTVGFLLPDEGSARHHRSLFLQVSQQLLKMEPRELRRAYATPFEPLPITRTFHVVVSEAATYETTTESSSSKKAPLTLFESLDLEHKSSLEDGEQEKDEGCFQQTTVPVSTSKPATALAEAHQQSQATQYVKLLEDLVNELQSPVFPLFVPATTTTTSSPDNKATHNSTKQLTESSHQCFKASKPTMELDINIALFSSSVTAHCHLTAEQLLLWYFQFGQLLGIAWRSGVLLPLQCISQAFWQELVNISDTNTQSASTNGSEHPSVHLDETLRSTVLQAIRDGLFAVVPSRCVVSLLTPAQVRTRLCDPHTLVTIQQLKLSAQQYDAHALHHSMFWAIVDAFTAVERVALLGFLTGSNNSRWPMDHEPTSSTAKFVLEISSDSLTLEGSQQSHHPDACYPVVVPSSDNHSARLHLPAYSSVDAMRKKLVLAMTTHCSG